MVKDVKSKANADPETWKDDLLIRSCVNIEEFNSMPSHMQTWILQHKHVFYNAGASFLNLLHHRNKALADVLKKPVWNKN